METALIVLASIIGVIYAMMTVSFTIIIIGFTKNRNIFGIDKKTIVDIYDDLVDHAVDKIPEITKKTMEASKKIFEEDL